MALPEDSVARFCVIADGFTAIVAGTTDWGAQSPVAEWKARDVVWHLVDWVPGLIHAGTGIQLPTRAAASVDPAGDWGRFDTAFRALLMDPATASTGFTHPQAGSMPLGTAIDMMITPDVFMHSWDLAQATGQQVDLDQDFAAGLLAGMQGIDEMLRASGQYGAKVAVPGDVDAVTSLMAFVGRDPQWRQGRAG